MADGMRRAGLGRGGATAWALGLVALAALTVAPGAAQEAGAGRLEVVVEHIAGSAVYIPAGRDQGLAAGDTLRAYRADTGTLLGLLAVVGVADGRASLTFAGRPFAITRGDRLLLERLSGVQVAAALSADSAESAPGDERAPPAGAGAVPRARALRGPASARSGAVVHGSVGLEVDDFRATSRFGGPGVAAVDRSVTTPALRLQATATGLPLGLEASANLRAAYRASSDTTYAPARSVRVYEASLSRRFTAVPLELRAGRFWSRTSSLRSFWDGGMVRVGGERWGIGGAAGYEPARGDEGVSTDVEKWSAFADYRYRGRGLTYATDFTFLDEHAPADGWSRRTLGWAQRARWGSLFLSNRLEVDLDPPDGGDALRRAFADLGLSLPGGLRLEGGYARDALRWRIPAAGAPLPPVLERWSAGGGWTGGAVSVSARGGRIRQGDGAGATSVDGSLHVAPGARSGLGAGLVAAYWDDGTFGSLFLSPSVSRSFGALATRVAYQFYGLNGAEPSTLHGVEGTADFPLRGGLSARVSARGQWGGEVTTLRTFTSLRMRF